MVTYLNETIPCEHCGKPVHKRCDRIVRFCSRECFMTANTPEKKTCPVCDKLFTPVNNSKCCSKSCAGKYRFMNIQKPTSNCLVCGKPFYPVKGKANRYCSTNCYNKHRFAQVIKQCPVCQSEFSSKISQNRVYCSRICKHIAKTSPPNAICSECGKSFKKQPIRLREDNKHFCSRECFAKYRTMPWVEYGSISRPDWRRLSDELTSNTHCYLCNETKDLSVHHIVPRRICRQLGIEPNFRKNLVPLCRRHHGMIEPKVLKLPELTQIGLIQLIRLLEQALLEKLPGQL